MSTVMRLEKVLVCGGGGRKMASSEGAKSITYGDIYVIIY